MIDTHVHLTMPDYQPGLSGVLARAKAAGVTRFVVPGIDLLSSEQAIALGHHYPEIIPAVGLHPLSDTADLRHFAMLAALPVVKAIGEIGTDSKAGDWSSQEERFRFFLDLAVKVGKPALIHIRDTWEPTLKVLADYPDLRGRAVIHCFTGGPAEAERVADLGLLLSFTAIIARKNMDATHDVIKSWPLDQMMIETDGPWLAWPGESWPNEPKTVAKVAEFVATLKNESVETVAKVTTQTAEEFFLK